MLLKKLKNFQSGDTIIEVLLSVSILGLVLAMSFTSSSRSLNAGTDAANRNQALAYAQEQVELLRTAANNGTISGFPTNGNSFCIDPATGAKQDVGSDNLCHINGESIFGVAVKYNAANKSYVVSTQWQGVNIQDQVSLYYQVPVDPISTPPNIAVSISATPPVIAYDSSSTVNWSATSKKQGVTVATCTASGGWAGTQPASGTATFNNVKTTQTYTLTCTGSDGTSSSASAKLYVSQLPAPVVKLNATPQAVNSGGSSTLSWTTTNAFKCTASGGWSGNINPAGGSQSTGPLNSSTNYILQCVNRDDVSSGSDSTTVKVNPVPTISFTAARTSVSYKDSTTLSWSSTGASNCVASGAWSGNQGTSGSVSTGQLTGSQTYYLRCDGAGGSSPTASQTITVGPSGIYSYYYQGANFNAGGWGPYLDGQINWCSSPSCSNGWLPVLRARTYMSEASCASVYWVGQILADTSGSYKMETFSDDGVRLAIDGNYVISNWTQHSETYDANYYYMSAGWHSVQVWYQNNNGNGCSSGSDYAAAIQLIWTPPGAGSRNQVPQDHLRPY